MEIRGPLPPSSGRRQIIMKPLEENEYKYAVVYPLRPEHIARILGGKTTFCKYIGKPQRLRVREGTKLIFYSSGGFHEIVGEAEIDEVGFHSIEAALEKYRKSLFLTEEELVAYRGRFLRPSDEPLLVMSLKGIRKYRNPIRLEKPITMSGLTLTEEQYGELLGPFGEA